MNNPELVLQTTISLNEINVFFKGLNYSVKFDDPLVVNSVASDEPQKSNGLYYHIQ